MTDPTIPYPATAEVAPGVSRMVCCPHLPNLHDRNHCLAARCECTREAWVLRRQRELQAEAHAAAQEAGTAPPDGYELFVLEIPCCTRCGVLVGDPQRHDSFTHPPQEARP